MRRYRFCAAIITALVFVAGCAPTLPTSQMSLPAEWSYSASVHRDTLATEPLWWRNFGDTTLNNLVERALLNNRDLGAAVARVRSADHSIKEARSAYLPQLSLNGYGEGLRTQVEGHEQEYYIEPTISWELPIFGQLSQTNRKARSEAMGSLWAMCGVQLLVVSEVVESYFTLGEAQLSRSISERSYALRRESAALIDSMSHYGMSDGVALAQARSLEYSARADVSSYERAEAQARIALSTLLGEPLCDTLAGSLDVTLPHSVALGVPSDLLERRPDVMEAAATLDAAAASVGLARAARYPVVSITAAGGLYGTSLKSLSLDNGWAWSVIGELAQPIFKFGGLKGRERAAREAYLESLMNYEQTILTAMGDVEEALVGIESYAEQRAALVSLNRANTEIAEMNRALYREGLTDYLDVIDAERELYSSQLAIVEATTNHYLSYINLYKSLGGALHTSH